MRSSFNMTPPPDVDERVALGSDRESVNAATESVVPMNGSLSLGDLAQQTGIDETLGALSRDLVGLAPVKEKVHEIAALLLVERVRARFGLQNVAPSLHMSFTGSPGTGKTTVAKRMATVLHQLGYLPRDHIVTASRDDLVGQFIGHTAPKTKEVLSRALGGVLFIDEAYHLYRPENERDYGIEAIEILMTAMEDHRGELAVIVAGYRSEMEQFFLSNPGLHSRVGHHVDFPDFSHDELVHIAARLCAEIGYVMDEEAKAAFDDYLALRMAQPHFSNARSVRNAIDRARLRHAKRLVNDRARQVSRDDVMTLTARDIYGSRVFGTRTDDASLGE
jgi:probable Rubsico expression protein CbbX